MGSVLPEIDQETINELITCIHEAIDAIEIELDTLAAEPDNQEALHLLFRHLHSIKGNFRMCLLDPFTAYVHEIEETISEIRNANQRFSSLIKEACLFALDRLRHFMDLLQQYGEIEHAEMADIGHHFCAIAQSPPMQADNSALTLLEAFNCKLPDNICSMTNDDISHCPDLSDIQRLGLKLEALKTNNSTHTAQLAGLTAAISAFIESPINRQQLQAAIYLHDVDDILLDDPNCPEQFNIAPSDYLQQFEDWRYAGDIVKQMHEYIDVHSTCLETQLLSLARRFLELIKGTNNQPTHKGSILQALKLINEEVGSCFSSDVVGALNKTVLTFHQQQELSISQLAA